MRDDDPDEGLTSSFVRIKPLQEHCWRRAAGKYKQQPTLSLVSSTQSGVAAASSEQSDPNSPITPKVITVVMRPQIQQSVTSSRNEDNDAGGFATTQ